MAYIARFLASMIKLFPLELGSVSVVQNGSISLAGDNIEDIFEKKVLPFFKLLIIDYNIISYKFFLKQKMFTPIKKILDTKISYSLLRQANFRNQPTLYIPTVQPIPDITKERLRKIVEDPNWEEHEKLQQQKNRLAELKQMAYDNPANEKNPKNIIKVKVIRRLESSGAQSQQDSSTTDL